MKKKTKQTPTNSNTHHSPKDEPIRVLLSPCRNYPAGFMAFETFPVSKQVIASFLQPDLAVEASCMCPYFINTGPLEEWAPLEGRSPQKARAQAPLQHNEKLFIPLSDLVSRST